MPYRPIKKKQPQELEQTESELTPEQFVGYIRQSSTKQVIENPESGILQKSGAKHHARLKGLDPEKITIAYEGEGKRGVSGTLRIDQRDDLRDTMKKVYADKVKYIWSYSVSRLFRDKYGVQVATFIQACADHHVTVAIETAKVFDFTNFTDVMLFQILASMAARENEERSKLLHGGNAQKALRGLNYGGDLHVGYIVDYSKGSKTYERYIPYAPHRKVVEWLFKRYRELGGKFNLLASEIAKMPVLFPPFEAWVDPRNVHKLQIKKVCKLHGKVCDCKQEDCVLAGYHTTKKGLFFLLTAPEYAGYWRFRGELLTDADGQPLKNHEAIVPLDDWLYAFNRLSFVTLSGEDNQERISRTWVTSKKAQAAPLLEGLLVSPLGSVHSSAGYYRVMEKPEDKLHYVNTLVVPTLWVDEIFRMRLLQRLYEDLAGNENFLNEQLKGLKAKTVKALISVDEQIKNYRQAIANREAYIAAVGASLNKASALRLNAAMAEDQRQLDALIAKKDAANKEVTGVEELVQRIRRLTGRVGKSGFEGDEETQRFIRLACEEIALDEHSGHILTLTVKWRAPFAQTDVCYIYRTEAGRQHWNDADEQILHALYPEADRAEVMQAMPKRSWQAIKTHASELGIERRTHANELGSHGNNMGWLDVEMMRAHGHEFTPILKDQPVRVWWEMAIDKLEPPC